MAKDNHRGKGKENREENRWDRSPDLTQQVIACYHAKPSRQVDWESVEYDVGRHLSNKPFILRFDNRQQEIYFRRDNNDNDRALNNVQLLTEVKRKRNISLTSPCAYPSFWLTHAVEQSLEQAYHFSFYYVLVNGIPDDLYPCIYIVSEQEVDPSLDSAIYGGKTTVNDRMQSHLRNKKNISFMKYIGDHWNVSANWAVTIFPYEACRSFAVAGQLTPNLVDNQEFRQWLNDKYLEDDKWGLDQAERALFAYCHPHFNEKCNTYSKPLNRQLER